MRGWSYSMKKIVLLASVAFVSGTSAFAADLQGRRVAPVAPVIPAFTWTGFYAGLNAGVNWSSRNVETILNGSEMATGTYPAMVQALSPQPYSNSRTGFIGGAQIGYNYQINQFVIGAEADFMGMGVSKRSGTTGTGASAQDAGDFIGTPPGAVTLNSVATGAVSTKITQNWLGTVRARAGFAADRFLVYATGGLAYGNVKLQSSASLNYDQTFTDNTTSPPGVTPFMAGTVPWAGSKTSTQVGYTVGAGVEYAVTNNWIIRGEYLYYNLGSVTNLASVVGPAATGTVLETISISSKTKVDGNIVRAAVSYKF